MVYFLKKKNNSIISGTTVILVLLIQVRIFKIKFFEKKILAFGTKISTFLFIELHKWYGLFGNGMVILEGAY